MHRAATGECRAGFRAKQGAFQIKAGARHPDETGVFRRPRQCRDAHGRPTPFDSPGSPLVIEVRQLPTPQLPRTLARTQGRNHATRRERVAKHMADEGDRQKTLAANVAAMNGLQGFDVVIVCCSGEKQADYWQARLTAVRCVPGTWTCVCVSVCTYC